MADRLVISIMEALLILLIYISQSSGRRAENTLGTSRVWNVAWLLQVFWECLVAAEFDDYSK